MQRQYNALHHTAITSMLASVEKLQELGKKSNSLSNTSKFVSSIKSLRLTYNGLDEETRMTVDQFMQNDHQELLSALKKSGSQLPKINKLAGMIDDNLLIELKRILQAALALQDTFQGSHARVQLTMSDEGMIDTGTFKVMPSSTQPVQLDPLKLVLESPNLKQVSPSYLTYATLGWGEQLGTEDSLAIIISALEILLKTKDNKEKLQGDISTRFEEIYDNTLLREVNRLSLKVHQNTLKQLTMHFSHHPNFRRIGEQLATITNQDQTSETLLAIAENVSCLVNVELLDALQKKHQASHQSESPTISKRNLN